MMSAQTAAPAVPGIPLEGVRVVVAGLATSGTAAVRFLLARGAEVIVSDRRTERELGEAAAEARRAGAALDLGGHTASLFSGAGLVVVSPGVPSTLPALQAARRAGVPVIAEVELASRFLRGRIAGITGSNGKSTTTALTAAMLKAAGMPARACGNIGVPLIEMVDTDTPESVYAVELSSFQLEEILTLRCHAAAVVNLSPDHLDRHGSLEAYSAAKARIFLNQQAGDLAVLNADDAPSQVFRSSVRGRLALFSLAGPVENGACLRDGTLVFAEGGRTTPILAASEVPLAGRHNLENVLTAALLSRHLGASADAIRNAVKTFRPLPHRLEPIGATEGVLWVNDSKATNVDSAIKALESFPGRRIVLILGGRDKGGAFDVMRPLLADRARLVLLIGEAAGTIEAMIGGSAPLRTAGTLDAAVAAARDAAKAGDVVLLAPGCASFDQFRNYEDRGERFRGFVRALPGFSA